MKTLEIYYTVYASSEGEIASLATQGTVEDLVEALSRDLKESIPNLVEVNSHREILISIQLEEGKSND